MFNTNNSRWCDALRLQEQKQYTEAERILRELRDEYVGEPEIVHQHVRVLFLLGEGSVELLEREAAFFPQYLPLQRDVVALLLESGEKQKSLEKALQNFAVFGQLSELCTDCGVIFRHLGDNNQAEIYFQRALSIDSKSEYSWFNWANMYMEEGKFAEAEQMYIRALRIDDNNIEVWVQLIYSVLSQQDFGTALRFIYEAKKRGGEHPMFFYLQSLAHSKMKNIKEAMNAIHQALQSGDQKIFWEQLIYLLELQGEDVLSIKHHVKNMN